MAQARRGYCVLAVVAPVPDRKQTLAIAKYGPVSIVWKWSTTGNLRIGLSTLCRHFGN